MRGAKVLTALAAMALATGCGGSADEQATPEEAAGIRVASFDFSESRMLAELYAQALELDGFDVVRLGSIGPREVVAPAIEQGHIDVVPEYLGTASEHFGAASDDPDELNAVLEPRGLRALQPSPAQDVNVFVVLDTTADEHGLVTISDLGAVSSDFRLGGPVECPDRPHCLAGLQATYRLSFGEFVPNRSLAITAEALIRGEIEVGVLFSTAAQLTSGPFVILVDDRSLQPAENVIPLVRQASIDRWGPRFPATLDRVSSALTTEGLQTMNRRVDDGESMSVIAASWLLAIGLASSR